MKALIIIAFIAALAAVLWFLHKRNAPAVTVPTGGSGSKDLFSSLCGKALKAGAASQGAGSVATDSTTGAVCGALEKAGKEVIKGVEVGARYVGKGAKVAEKAVVSGAKDVYAGGKAIVGDIGNALGISDKDTATVGTWKGTHANVQKQINGYIDGGGTLSDAQAAQVAGDDNHQLYIPPPVAGRGDTAATFSARYKNWRTKWNLPKYNNSRIPAERLATATTSLNQLMGPAKAAQAPGTGFKTASGATVAAATGGGWTSGAKKL